MFQDWSKSQLILAVLVLALLVCSQLPLPLVRTVSSPGRAVVHAAVTPVRDPLQRAAHLVRAPEGASLDLEAAELEQDYQQLLQYARQLEQELRLARSQIAQLAQVRQRMSLEGVKLQPATITGPAGEARRRVMVLNRGRRDGLRDGLVVADGFHLVGRVTDAGPVTSTALLSTAMGVKPVVRIVPPVAGASPREAMVQLTSEEGRYFTVKVGVDKPIEVGDLAHLADDMWPPEAQALVVGRVTRVEPWPDDPQLYRRVVVEPMRSLVHLTRVVVLVPTGE